MTETTAEQSPAPESGAATSCAPTEVPESCALRNKRPITEEKRQILLERLEKARLGSVSSAQRRKAIKLRVQSENVEKSKAELRELVDAAWEAEGLLSRAKKLERKRSEQPPPQAQPQPPQAQPKPERIVKQCDERCNSPQPPQAQPQPQQPPPQRNSPLVIRGGSRKRVF